MDAQFQFEQNLMKRLFNLDGKPTSSSSEDIGYEVEDNTYPVQIRFSNGQANLYEGYAKNLFEHTDTKDLSHEDIGTLKKYGYTV